VIVDPFATAPLKVTVAFPSPAVAEIVVGAEAAPCAVTDEEVAETEFPTLLIATTPNAYAVPSVNPVHV
jgi:hypothetical protein